MGGRKYADSEGVRGRLGSTPALDSSLDLGLEQGRVEVGAEARAAVEHCAQSVRCLPGKHEDWRSIPRTAEHMAGGIAQWLEHIMLLQAT